MVLHKKISFHNHEVVGAQKVKDWMTELGFSAQETNRVTKLVRQHQYRFYNDSSRTTIRKWLEELGSKQAYLDQLHVRYADRKGNPKNDGKPLYTQEQRELEHIVADMIQKGEIVFPDELKVGWRDFHKLNIPRDKHKEAMSNMLGIVRANKERNTRPYLLEYLERNYAGKKDD